MKTNTPLTRILSALALGALALTAQHAAQAQVPMLAGLGNGPARNNFTGTIGYTFTTGPNPIDVTALGFVDWENGNGLLAAHQVGIWSNTTLIASATVPSGTAGNFVNPFYYANLGSPVRLAPNTTYTIGGQVFNGGDKWPDNVGTSSPGFTVPDFTGFPALTSGNNKYSTSAFAQPATAGGGNSLWNAVNLLGSSAVVPTPAFNPPAGSYIGAQTVTISAQSGSTVFYTTNGSNPTSASANGGVGTGSASVNVPAASTVTIMAYATNSAKADSAIASATYTTVTTPAVPTWIATANGSWTNAGNWSNNVIALGSGLTADFSTLTMVSDVTVTLDGARTIGHLTYGDVGNTYNWILNTGTGGPLSLDAGASQSVITVPTNTSTINVVLAGTNGFIKAGAGSLALSGNNNYTGSTFINNGTVTLLGAGQLNNTTNITIASGATLNLSGNNNGIQAGLSGTTNIGSLVINGTLAATVSGNAHTLYATNITLNNGTMAGATGHATFGMYYVASDRTITANGTSNVISSGNFGINAFSGQIRTLTLNTPLAADQLSVSTAFINANGGTGAKMAKTGAGTVILTGASTYTGATTVSNGTLIVNGSLGNTALSVAGGSLSGVGSINGSLAVQSGGTLSPGTNAVVGTMYAYGTLALGGQTHFRIDKTGGTPLSDSLTGMAGVTYGGTLVITNITSDANVLTNGDTFTLFSKYSGTYGGGFTNFVLPALGPGLSWDKSGLFVNGTVSVGNAAATPIFTPGPGAFIGSVSVTLSSDPGATIFYTKDGSDPTTSGTRISGTSPITGVLIPADTNLTLLAYATNSGFADSPVTPSALYQTITTPIWTSAFGGSWSDAFNWSNNVVGSGAGVLVDFSQLDLTTDATVDLNGPRTIGSVIFGDTSPDSNWIITNSVSGSLTLDNGTNAPVINVVNQSAILTAQLATTNGLTKTGNGTLVLTADNTYTGGTTVNAGTLHVAGANNSASRVGAGTLTINPAGTLTAGAHNPLGYGGALTPSMNVNGGTVNAGTNFIQFRGLTMTGGTMTRTAGGWIGYEDVTVNASATGSTIAGGDFYMRFDLNGNTNGTRTFTVADGSAPADLTMASRLINPGGVGATAGLVKAGPGALVLTATNTYTGATTVSNGTLLVNGSLAAGSAVTVVGGTLGGNGTIGGTVDVQAAGTLSPGASIGTLTINSNLTLAGNVLIEVDKSLVQSNDIVNVSGSLTYGGTLTATNLGTNALVAGDSFPVFPAGGTGSLTLAGSPGAGLNWSFNPTSGVLSVVGGVATNPTNLLASVSGGQLTLSWPADHMGWTLQAQTNNLSVGLTGTWYDVAGSTTTNQMTFPIDHTKPTVFYRMAHP
jgi:autotransporter-associated beta strand protein